MSDNISYHPNYRPDDRARSLRATHARSIAITSGKGGVGKTNIATNLSIALATRHARVCIFDADTNLANINILLGLTPQYTLEDLLQGNRSLDEIIMEGPRGIHVIPAASGIADLTSLTPEQQSRLIAAMQELEKRYDYLIIDTAAGIGDTVISFLQSAQQTIVVISPEPTSLTDAFSLLKVLRNRGINKPTHVIVNMVMGQEHGLEVFKRFESAIEKYLEKEINYLGYIPLDENIISSVTLQQPVIIQKPSAAASRCFYNLATAIGDRPDVETGSSFSEYWKENLVTPTGEIQAMPFTRHQEYSESDPNRLLTQFRQYLLGADTTEAQASALLTPLLDTYVNVFESFPGDAKKTLYRALETGLISDEELRDLVMTLETVYESRTNRTLRNYDDAMIRLLSGLRGNEGGFMELRRLLEESYRRQCHRALYNSREEFLAQLNNADAREEDFSEAISAIKQAYSERFQKPYQDEKDQVIANVKQIAERMQKKEADLMQDLARMSESLTKTAEDREELMRQISNPEVPNPSGGQDPVDVDQ